MVQWDLFTKKVFPGRVWKHFETKTKLQTFTNLMTFGLLIMNIVNFNLNGFFPS